MSLVLPSRAGAVAELAPTQRAGSVEVGVRQCP